MTNALPEPASAARCPWCSAELVSPADTRCRSCGAILISEGEPQVPGVTSLDPEVMLRSRREPPKRNRLLSWITGESDEQPTKQIPPDALAPPPPDVRREMLRIELEAEGVVAPEDTDPEAAEAEAAGDRADAPVESSAETSAQPDPGSPTNSAGSEPTSA